MSEFKLILRIFNFWIETLIGEVSRIQYNYIIINQIIETKTYLPTCFILLFYYQ